MQKTNDVTLTGVFTLTQITDTFQKQSVVFGSKDRDGNWKDGDFEIYVKPDLIQQNAIANGDTVKLKGFMVFSFFTKQDGTQMSFPKLIATDVLEVEKAGIQPAGAQPTQPQAMMNTGVPVQPPMPGAAPTMPPQPQAAEAFPPPAPAYPTA